MVNGSGSVPRPNLSRLVGDLAELAKIKDPAESGATRRVFKPEYVMGREWITERMRNAGLDVAIDAGGNLIGRRPGVLPALVTGSHSDTVSGAGILDGALGIVGAIEAVRMLDEAGIALSHELKVVDFLGEEPNEWGISCLGSRVLAGELGPHELACTASNGTSLSTMLQDFGVDPERVEGAAWGRDDVHAFLELHIEQGPILEQANLPIGIVTGIVGVERFLLTFHGRRDHAGTMPMSLRHDAVAAAAESILTVEKIVSDGLGVGTCGQIEIEPGALNVVPDLARVGVELRSVDNTWIEKRRSDVVSLSAEHAAQRGVHVEIHNLSSERSTRMSKKVQTVLGLVADNLGYRHQRLPSGAEHDAGRLAKLGPTGMIFVPSIAGRSHCPEEATEPEDLAAGVATLAGALVLLDQTPKADLLD